jgi:hypothetical protein
MSRLASGGVWLQRKGLKMTITVLDNGWISDSFTIGESPSFTDALVMPPNQYNALTFEQIEAMKQDRYDSWVAMIKEASEEIIDG